MPRVGDVMRDREVISVGPRAQVSEAAAAMVKGQAGSVVVLDGNWLAGIFTERDVLRAAGSGADLNTSPVADWMTEGPVTATRETAVDEAVELMMAHGFRHLPVVDGDAVIGVVSLRDLVATGIRRPG